MATAEGVKSWPLDHDSNELKGTSTRSRVLESAIPDLCMTEPCCMGIDEAGRGPVLGPMVYAAVYSPTSRMESMKQLGFADSKQLTEARRDELLEVIHQHDDDMGWLVHILSPGEVSCAMLQGHVQSGLYPSHKQNKAAAYNLNDLSHDTAIGLVKRALERGVKVEELYVDTVGHAGKYQALLQDIFPGMKVTVESKADDTYPIVSAASICAKTARDGEVKQWSLEEERLTGLSREYGSGYPGDPVTKAWLIKSVDPVFGFPSLVRFSWGTAKKIIDEKCVPVVWPDGDAAAPPHQHTLTQLLDKRKPRHRYFEERGLASVTDL